MPKEIQLTGRRLSFGANVVLLVGSDASPQSKFGAEWINKRLADLGGVALSVSPSGTNADGKVQIVIGTRDDNPLIAKAVAEGVVNVGPGNPGARGYEIRTTKDGKTLYLAGADPIGALYACVTVGELLEKQSGGEPALRMAEVRDWPDIEYLYAMGTEPPIDIVKRPNDPDAREKYLGKMSKMYDDMLRRKLSMVWYKPLSWGEMAFREMTPYARETARMGIEEGKKRGIASLYYHLYPFVGPASDHPNVNPDFLEVKAKARYGSWIQSWSMDEERRAYARELAQWIREIGFTDVGFHDTDTGGYVNPANWNQRGKADRERWGDDYAAATINKFRIFYEELKKANPELQLNFTLYPYNSDIFDPSEQAQAHLRKSLNLDAAALGKYREKYASFWKQLHAAFPKGDVAFAIREPWGENGEPGLKAFLSLIPGRPLFAWYGLAAAEFYSNVPAWLGSLHSGSSSDLVFTQNNYIDKGYVPILSYAMREYSWNTKAPGADKFRKRDRAKMYDSAAGDHTTKAFTVVLPHLVRNYFGQELAPDITKAITANCSPYIVFGGRPERNIVDETEARMDIEAGRAATAAQAMDAAWAKLSGENGVKFDPEVISRVVYLRQVFHSTKLAAGIKAEVYRSQRLSSLNRFEEALAAIQKGVATLEEERRILKVLAKQSPTTMKALPYCAKWTLDGAVPLLENLLNQRTLAIEAGKKSGGISTSVLNQLAQVETLPVVTAQVPPIIDGKADEPEWKKAHPQEAWFISGSERLVADARTQIKVLSDANNLYISFKCWGVAGEEIGLKDADREFVRIYLNLPSKGGSTMSAFGAWANGKLEIYDKRLTNPVEFKATYGGASAGFWQGEIRIPFKSLSGVKPSRIGFLRGYSHSGVANVSSTIPLEGTIAGPFDAALPMLERFPAVEWNQNPFQASARVRIVEPKVVREVTLDDRIATVAEFRVTADADSILDNVVLEVEAIGEEGKMEARKEIVASPFMPYSFKPGEVYNVAFLQAVDKGSIRLKLRSDQVSCETTYSFNSKQETGGKKSPKDVNEAD